jgi:hypothetical protein
MTVGLTCPECKGGTVFPATGLPGLSKCQHCGKVFPTPDVPDVPVISGAEGDKVELDDRVIEIPDAVDVAIGWRTWSISVTGNIEGEVPQMRLRSVSHSSFLWLPREAVEAKCSRSTGKANGVDRKGHEVPDEHCSCGLYSAKTFEHLQTMSYHFYDADSGFNAVGRVKLWGKVVEGTQGWRAQYGYPETLYVPFEAWRYREALEEQYGVKVLLKNILDEGGEE